MNDPGAIHEAYAEAFRELFATFLDTLRTAGSRGERTLAGNNFHAGVRAARAARDQALARSRLAHPARGRPPVPDLPSPQIGPGLP